MDSLYRRLNTAEEDINGLGVNMRKLPRMQSKKQGVGKQEREIKIYKGQIRGCNITLIRNPKEIQE